jgi:hypothetical protein
VLGGVAVGFVWMYVAMAATGGYLLAGRYSYFWVWSVGAVAGLLAATLPLSRRGAAAGAGAVAAVAAFTGWVVYRTGRPALALEIAVAPGATSADVARVWSHVLGDPEPTGTGYRSLPGLRVIRRLPRRDGAEHFAVDFDAWASAADSARVAARLRAAPQVAGARWTRAGP